MMMQEAKKEILEKLLSRMDRDGIAKAELARRAKNSRQQIGNITNMNSPFSLEMGKKLLACVGIEMIINLTFKDIEE